LTQLAAWAGRIGSSRPRTTNADTTGASSTQSCRSILVTISLVLSATGPAQAAAARTVLATDAMPSRRRPLETRPPIFKVGDRVIVEFGVGSPQLGEVIAVSGQHKMITVRLSEGILGQGDMPLQWNSDGRANAPPAPVHRPMQSPGPDGRAHCPPELRSTSLQPALSAPYRKSRLYSDRPKLSSR
jgi:hypothetical protein